MRINEYLKIRRKELQLTLVEVADKCGVSEATVSRWESGDIENMRRSKIAAYAKALRLSPVILEVEAPPSLILSKKEEELVVAYRNAPDGRKDAVRALLNMEE